MRMCGIMPSRGVEHSQLERLCHCKCTTRLFKRRLAARMRSVVAAVGQPIGNATFRDWLGPAECCVEIAKPDDTVRIPDGSLDERSSHTTPAKNLQDGCGERDFCRAACVDDGSAVVPGSQLVPSVQ